MTHYLLDSPSLSGVSSGTALAGRLSVVRDYRIDRGESVQVHGIAVNSAAALSIDLTAETLAWLHSTPYIRGSLLTLETRDGSEQVIAPLEWRVRGRDWGYDGITLRLEPAQASALARHVADGEASLDGAITASASQATFAAGAPAAAFLWKSGREIIEVAAGSGARSVSRAMHGTTAQAHDDGASGALARHYAGTAAEVILAALADAGLAASDYDGAQITGEADTGAGTQAFGRVVFRAVTARNVIDSLLSIIGGILYWDVADGLLRLAIASPFSTDIGYVGSAELIERPELRVSQRVDLHTTRQEVYGHMANVLEPESYRAAAVHVDADAESAAQHGIVSSHRIDTHWLQSGTASEASARAAAVARVRVQRFRNVPVAHEFASAREAGLTMGQVIDLREPALLDGARRVQVTGLRPHSADGSVDVVALERADASLGAVSVAFAAEYTIAGGTSINLYSAVQAQAGHPPTGPVTIRLVAASGAVFGSDGSAAAIIGGPWHPQSVLTLDLRPAASATGYGGPGNSGSGGPAVSLTSGGWTVQYDSDATNGGGGGGGLGGLLFTITPTANIYQSGGGGGGAGRPGGAGGEAQGTGPGNVIDGADGADGTATAGGVGGQGGFGSFALFGGTGGTGGAPGQAGALGQPGGDSAGAGTLQEPAAGGQAGQRIAATGSASVVEEATDLPDTPAQLLARSAGVYAVAMSDHAALAAEASGAFGAVAAPTAENGATYDAAGRALNVGAVGADSRHYALPAGFAAALAGADNALVSLQYQPTTGNDTSEGNLLSIDRTSAFYASTPAGAVRVGGIEYLYGSASPVRLRLVGHAGLTTGNLLYARGDGASGWHGVAARLSPSRIADAGLTAWTGGDARGNTAVSTGDLRLHADTPWILGGTGAAAHDFDDRIRQVVVVLDDAATAFSADEWAVLGAWLSDPAARRSSGDLGI